MIQFGDEKQKQRVQEIRAEEAEDLAILLSGRYGVPYIDLSTVSIDTDALRIVPELEAREAQVAVFAGAGKKIKIAIVSPGNKKSEAVVEELKSKNFEPTLYIASETSLEHAWVRYKDIAASTATKIGEVELGLDAELARLIAQIKSVAYLKDLLKKESSGPTKSHTISNIFEIALAGAIAIDASDIHLEPEEAAVRLRYRIDGILEDVAELGKEILKLMISRIKITSQLKLNVHDVAQDGRFSVKLGNEEIEVRVSIVPGAYGESVVMRVLNPKNISVPFEELGFEPHLFNVLEKEIRRPNGMILTTGPTGSGKTTTLYGILRKVNDPGSKIITIEDPIEYHLKGINQTQTDDEKGYGFLEGLRAALRQDPDVIMVGEIRDKETANVAINASLTGHLVLSTLHTNNAGGTIPRLIDLEVNPKIIGSALRIAMAQRLIRKLCESCKVPTPLNEEERRLVASVIKSLPDSYKGAVAQQETTWKPPVEKAGVAHVCTHCNNGYKGRIGIFEAILVDEGIERLIIENPSEREITEAAKGQGMLNMQQDGLIKVLKGVTSLEELQRVVTIE
jgi:type IV pilus assembly protein PilB